MPKNTAELSLAICEFVGAFIGDGHIGRYGKKQNCYVISISGDSRLDKDYLEKFLKPLIKKNFAYTNPKVYYRSDENTMVLRIYSKRLYNFFVSLGFKQGIKSHRVKIPGLILKNKDNLSATVRGIFDTDGCVYLDKRESYKRPYPRITLQSASIALLKQIQTFLSQEYSLYFNITNRDGYRNYLEIYGHKQLEKFLKGIGFSNARHLNKVRNALVA